MSAPPSVADARMDVVQRGWLWLPQAEEDDARRLIADLYGPAVETTLRAVTAPAAPPGGPRRKRTCYVLCNPVEAAQWDQWMPRAEHRMVAHRYWFTTMTAGDTVTFVDGSHRPEHARRILAEAGRIPLQWTTRPHLTGPLRTGPSSDRGTVFGAPTAGVFVCIDNLCLLCDGSPRVWSTWHPAAWDTGAEHRAPPDGVRRTRRKRTDWWTEHRRIRVEILERVRAGDAADLLLFDELGVVDSDLVHAVVPEAAAVDRFFDTSGGVHRLRESPALDAAAPPESVDEPAGPAPPPAEASHTCARTVLLNRSLASFARGALHPGIVDFTSLDQLLLPYGHPETRGAAGDVWLPPLVAAATGCARIRVHRDNTTSGHFLELDDHGTLDVIDFQDAWEQLERLPVAADVPQLLGLRAVETRVRIGLSVGADTRETHGILVLCLLYLHPFLLLDEAVSLAVAVCILVYHDNRTMTDEHLKRCAEWHRVQWARLLDSDPSPADVAAQWRAVTGSIPRPQAIATHRPRAARVRSVPVPLCDPWAADAPEPKKKCIRETLAALQVAHGPPRGRPTTPLPSRLTQVKRLLTRLNKHQRWQHGMRRGFSIPVDPRLVHSVSSFTSSP